MKRFIFAMVFVLIISVLSGNTRQATVDFRPEGNNDGFVGSLPVNYGLAYRYGQIMLAISFDRNSAKLSSYRYQGKEYPLDQFPEVFGNVKFDWPLWVSYDVYVGQHRLGRRANVNFTGYTSAGAFSDYDKVIQGLNLSDEDYKDRLNELNIRNLTSDTGIASATAGGTHSDKIARHFRGEEFRDVMREAEALFSRRSYDQAKLKYQEALKLSSYVSGITGPHPRDRIREIDNILRQQEQEAKKEEDYHDLIRDADYKFRAGNYTEALVLYEQALVLERSLPDNDGYASRMVNETKAKQDMGSLREEYDRLVSEAQKKYANLDSEEALKLFVQAENLTKKNPELGNYPTQMIARISSKLQHDDSEEETGQSTSSSDNYNTGPPGIEHGYGYRTGNSYEDQKRAWEMEQKAQIDVRIAYINQRSQYQTKMVDDASQLAYQIIDAGFAFGLGLEADGDTGIIVGKIGRKMSFLCGVHFLDHIFNPIYDTEQGDVYRVNTVMYANMGFSMFRSPIVQPYVGLAYFKQSKFLTLSVGSWDNESEKISSNSYLGPTMGFMGFIDPIIIYSFGYNAATRGVSASIGMQIDI